MPTIGQVITKVRNLFKNIRHSEVLRQKLKLFCETENIDYVEPELDVKTRWNSTFCMILSGLKLKNGLKLLINSRPDLQKYFLTDKEWEILDTVVSILHHFKEVSDLLCGEKYVTLSSAVVKFNVLIDKIENTSEVLDKKVDRNEIDKMLIVALQASRDKMLKHYHRFNWIYCIVLVLDPRFKTGVFEKTKWGKELKNCSYDKFLEIYKSYWSDEIIQIDEECKDNNNNIDDEDALYENNIDYKSSYETELNNYLTSRRPPKETNILHWWKSNAHLYPTLAKMARDFLCIPATSVPCERVFSEAGNVVTKLRCCLSKEKTRALVCINMWMKSVLKKLICKVNI